MEATEPLVQKRKLNLDLQAIETVALSYPEEMRDPLIWLAGYIREECNRSMPVFEEKIRNLGFEVTRETIGKILRGGWNRNGEGKRIPPVWKLENFLQLVERLRTESQIAAMAGKVPFVETSTWETIKNYIDSRRAPDRICKFGLIIGPTGSQKTACFKQYALRNNHGACVWMESPETPSLGQFITDLSFRYGCSIYASQQRKKFKIKEIVNAHRTIIVDNVQRLFAEESRGTVLSSQPLFNYLQKLQDDTGCTIILSVTPEFDAWFSAGSAAGYFEQFEGRCGGRKGFLWLDKHAPRSDVLAIARAFGLADASSHIKYLEELSRQRGRIRVLFNALQNAKQIADEEGKSLTIDHLREAAATPEEAGN